jgi:ribonuclease-3
LALTHASYAHEHGLSQHNERLEFLGDAVLALVIGDALYRRFPGEPEGELTARRAALVCEASLSEVAQRLGLGPKLRLGRGEASSGGRERPSILAAALEALLGAAWLDRGLSHCQQLVEDWFGPQLDSLEGPDNPKAKLQELVQQHPGWELEYRLVEEKGPPHAPTFAVSVYVGGRQVGSGLGKSKKAAEKSAARASLEALGHLRAEGTHQGHHPA